jgi:hypothetical protein
LIKFGDFMNIKVVLLNLQLSSILCSPYILCLFGMHEKFTLRAFIESDNDLILLCICLGNLNFVTLLMVQNQYQINLPNMASAIPTTISSVGAQLNLSK